MEKAIWTPQILHLPPPSLHSIHTFLHLFIQLHPRIHTDLRAPTTSCMPHSPALHTTISTSLLLTFCLSAPTPQCPHHVSCRSLYCSACHFSLSSHLCCLFHHSITQSPLYLLLPVTVSLAMWLSPYFSYPSIPLFCHHTPFFWACVCVCVSAPQ